jgi:hypothetical protein
MPADSDGRRWARLERYARFRARRLPLLDLPYGVLHHLVYHFLDAADHRRLAEALLGRAPDLLGPRGAADLAALPEELRTLFLQQEAIRLLEQHVRGLSDLCFYHTDDRTRALVVVDWSPFAREPPLPVAEYHWSRTPPHSRVTVHAVFLRHRLARALARRRPCVQVAVYLWGDDAPPYYPRALRHLRLALRPLCTGGVLVAPHALVDQIAAPLPLSP